MPARLPDFLGIGTQKGGTTSLHQWLNRHPQVFLPKCKEVHYFDLNFKNSEEWYSDHFQNATKEQRCGEITPMYMYHPKAPERIHKLIPNVKMIVLLRDPAERTISQICHAIQRNFEALNPSEAIAAEDMRLKSGNAYSIQKHSYISRSKYLEQLERYEAHFESNQLLILKSEDLFAHHSKSWNKIAEFLGINNLDLSDNFPKANQRHQNNLAITQELRDAIRERLIETGRGVRERYGFGWDWA